MRNNNIIIHIPKTGGTTLISNLYGQKWQPSPSFNYRHIIYQTKKSNSEDIFIKNNLSKYKNYNFILFIRDPFERIISEYNFLKCRHEFMGLFDKKPSNLKEYIENLQTHNSIIKFLIGKRIFTSINNELCQQKLYEILYLLDNLNFIIGKTEEYSDSLNIISNELNININKTIYRKRITLYKEPIDNYDELKDLFIKNNKLDYILYDKLNKIFNKQREKIKSKISYNFVGNKYDYIIKYTQRFCILEAFNVNKYFLEKNKKKLKIIHNIAIKNINSMNTENGKLYLTKWLELFIKSFKLNIEINYTDPIQTIEEFSDIKENIFIHVPKTGGSTFVNLLQESLESNKKSKYDKSHITKNICNIEIKHINFSHTKRISYCFDIFKKVNFNKYNNYNIFMMVRHPIDRLISEFIFQYHILGGRKNAAIISKLEPMPHTFFDYITYPQVWNYQTAFLIGLGTADKNRPTQKNLDTIIRYCNKYPINIGITEDYDNFINKFEKITKYKLKDNPKIYKRSPDNIKQNIINNMTDDTKKYILDKNNLDYQLYLYAKSKLV